MLTDWNLGKRNHLSMVLHSEFEAWNYPHGILFFQTIQAEMEPIKITLHSETMPVQNQASLKWNHKLLLLNLKSFPRIAFCSAANCNGLLIEIVKSNEMHS